MRKIDGKAKSINEVLAGNKFTVDYYQREYQWQKKQVAEFVADLAEKFLEFYDPELGRAKVQNYSHYFLGSIILCEKDGLKYIIDGQQRLTTVTLLLIYLNNLQKKSAEKVTLDNLIFSEKYGQKSFNIHVEEREACLRALYHGEEFDPPNEGTSVKNIYDRYQDIEANFPIEEIDNRALPFFCDWLKENVHVVEITAYSDDDAYTIFETMNDRGLQLSPLDMLKGYILTNIKDGNQRNDAAKVWKAKVEELGQLEDEYDLGNDLDGEAFKAWFRGQYANSIRERKKGATAQDFDRIGTEFHRWIKENSEKLGLTNGESFHRFVTKDLDYFLSKYIELRRASVDPVTGLEELFFNSSYDNTLQFPAILSALNPSDNDATFKKKAKLIATYVDIVLTRRIWNLKLVGYSNMQYAMFVAIKDVRNLGIEDLCAVLTKKLDEDELGIGSKEQLKFQFLNRGAIAEVLARLTDYVEVQSGLPSIYEKLVAPGKHRFEVEHIWANHFSRHTDEFTHQTEFEEYRNHIGGLLLLPKTFNASYGDLEYEKKLEHYFGQNMLARSLHPRCYERNPGFLAFVERSRLPFKPHPRFRKADMDERQKLYTLLGQEIWSPKRLERIISGS